MKLIDKSAVVAEIKRLKVHSEEAVQEFGREGYTDNVLFEQSKIRICETLLSLLDTLEVKEIDLKNELKEDWLFADKTEVDCLECMCLTEDMFVSIAKKYFQLGIKAQKGKEV